MPSNSTIMALGKLSKLEKKGLYMVELAAHNNLQSVVVVEIVETSGSASYY